jgi:hypothetical protein
MRDAIDDPHGIAMKIYAEIFPSRVFFNAITSDFPVTGSDPLGIDDDAPMGQDIEYSSVSDKLITFFEDIGVMKYAKQGSSTIHGTAYSTICKPGVLGNKCYLYHSNETLERYTINWNDIESGSATPLSSDITPIAMDNIVYAVHAVSDTRAIALEYDNGGFRPVLVNGTNVLYHPERFMFPTEVQWSGSGRALIDLGTYSGALQLGNRIFVYISHASKGTVEGTYYDLDTGSWSDVFTVVPTELQTSLCEFRVANAYSRNGTAYLCGQFNRTDIFGTGKVYSLLLYSQDGKTFSVDRLTLVSDIGYRFLARVGSDNNLYLGNCNRVCKAPVTWVFDGTNGTSGRVKTLTGDEIKNFSDDDYSGTLSLKSGNEALLDDPDVINNARVKVYLGYQTTSGSETVLWGTYIVDGKNTGFKDAGRKLDLRIVGEAIWRLSGLNMPFYAELFGKSVLYDPMTEESGKLYAAEGSALAQTKFWVDFWGHEPYNNVTEGITGIDMNDSGGVNYYESAATPHKLGIISKDVKEYLSLKDYPEVTGTPMDINIHGWSHPATSGSADICEVILVMLNPDGSESTIISNADTRWKTTYPSSFSGEEPIAFQVSATVGQKIKKVGVVFENNVASWFNVARVEIASNILVEFYYEDTNTPWERTDQGYFRIPGSGRPFIMFSQRPYNAFNFTLSAKFNNSTTGAAAGCSSSVGLVGLAEDAQNYIVARYDKVSNGIEIARVRDGIDTTLTSGSASFTVGDVCGITFTHRNGYFTVHLYNVSTDTWQQELTYDWSLGDGFLFTSDVASRKCGIYGEISTPSFPILGYWASSDELSSNSDGIPADPLSVLTGFPGSGQVKIGENIYQYTSVISMPTPVRGPYQYRQAGTYTPPYGDGSTGLECRDFDWTASTSALNNYLIALSSGACFVCSGALWQIFTTTGGVVEWRYNRARYYSANTQIGKLWHTLSHKVFVTGGLGGVSKVSGTINKHLQGDVCSFYMPGEIQCYWFMGTGGEDATTIADLVEDICQLAGTGANFPGDFTSGSMSVNGTTIIQSLNYADGFDLYFTVQDSRTVDVQANVQIKPDNYEEAIEGDTSVKVILEKGTGNAFKMWYMSEPSDTRIFQQDTVIGDGSSKIDYRIVFHENAITVIANGRWVSSCVFDELIYPEDELTISVGSGSPITIEDVVIRELGDWREAVYIDLETDARSAIGSVIQERPVEYYMNPDGRLDFWYDYTSGSTPFGFEPKQHEIAYVTPSEGASDAIVYSAEKAQTLQYAPFASSIGFATRVMRFPNLYSGAIKAAYISLKRMFEKSEQHNVTMRPDISLRAGDVLLLDYYMSATQRHMQNNIVVESVGINYSDGRQSMSVRGRKDL